MADFDITRAEATAGMNGHLRRCVYTTFLASWRHPEGALVCAGHVPDFPNVYVVVWRATPFWAEDCVATIDAFEETDADKAWARILRVAEEAYTRGPRGQMLDKGREGQKRDRERAVTGGRAGGKAKAANDRAHNAELIEAARIAAKYGFAKIPQYDPRKWTLGADDTMKSNPRFYLTRNGTNEEVTVEVIRGPLAYFVNRYWPSSFDDNASSIINDRVIMVAGITSEDPSLLDQVLAIVNRVVATEPRTWNLRDVGKFSD